MMLGDLGANVIKVERSAGGDETRGWGPPFDDRGESAYFLSVNRNKRSLTVDLDRPEDQALVRRLAGEADVVIENFLPGALSRRGLDADRLLAEFPALIWCTIGGYPDAPERPGYDFAVQAESGWMSVTGEPGGAPMKTAVALVDVISGKDAAIAVLAALAGRRDRPVAERRIHVTLAGSATAALVNVAQNALVSGAPARRWGNAHANLVPYQLFETADRPVVIAVGNDGQWRALAAELGDGSLRERREFATNADRIAHRDVCVAAVQAELRTAPAAEWVARCQRAGVPVGEVRTVTDVLASVDGSSLYGMPSSVGGQIRRAPPRLGEHDAEIRRHGWRIPDELEN